MQTILIFLIVSLSGIMLIQDLRDRAISWYLFPLLLIPILLWYWEGYNAWTQSILVNLSFLLLNLLLSLLWFRLKGISIKHLLNGYIGLGDLLLFAVLACSMPFYIFVPFQVFSLFASTLIGLSFFKKSSVPLAGFQVGFLAILILFQLINVFPLNHLKNLFT
jgi:Flp pilus assembly protein protease CpaA